MKPQSPPSTTHRDHVLDACAPEGLDRGRHVEVDASP
jgi:hypothetical protein